MTTLSDWIGYGMSDDYHRKQAMVRRWVREYQERRPIIDQVNYPDDPYYQRRMTGRG